VTDDPDGSSRTPREGNAADDGGAEATSGGSGREVVVPMRLYKTVTVFSTLFAMVGVVGGFVLLDAATNRGRASFAEIDLLLAFAGLGAIVFAGLVYAYSTRFRADRMGKSKDDTTQADDNG
jgi:hypothetical protein